MRFLCISAPLPGHLDWGGYLRTAAALTARGHDVLWVSGAEVFAAVQATGVPFQAVSTVGWQLPPPLPADLPAAVREQQRQPRAIAGWLEPEAVCQGVEALQAVAAEYRPDVILSELFVTAAPIVAEQRDVPLVICGWPAQITPPPQPGTPAQVVLQEARRRLAAICTTTGVRGRYWPDANSFWPRSPYRHIVYFSPRWYGTGSPLLAQTVCVGGKVEAYTHRGATEVATTNAPEAALPADRPLLLVTLGSLFTDDIAFFVNVTHAVAELGGHSVVASGRSGLAPGLLERLRQRQLPHVTLLDWVDYAWLLPRVALVVHHGGMGTTHAAICHGLPQLMIPHAGDQALQAWRAAAAGVGIHLPPAQASLAQLQAALADLLTNPAWRPRAAALQAEFAALGGPDRAAAILSGS
jgi:UDP:flavonoid glycosyltransferase YjiC (YdhE family)